MTPRFFASSPANACALTKLTERGEELFSACEAAYCLIAVRNREPRASSTGLSPSVRCCSAEDSLYPSIDRAARITFPGKGARRRLVDPVDCRRSSWTHQCWTRTVRESQQVTVILNHASYRVRSPPRSVRRSSRPACRRGHAFLLWSEQAQSYITAPVTVQPILAQEVLASGTSRRATDRLRAQFSGRITALNVSRPVRAITVNRGGRVITRSYIDPCFHHLPERIFYKLIMRR